MHSPFDDNLSRHGCITGGEITMIVHGWGESIATPWVNEMAQNYLSLRKNCVFFMDYSNFSSKGYFDLTPHFSGISAVLRKKLLSLGSPAKMQLFGFSFGARLVVDAGIELSAMGEKVDRIYACDPAGPGFFYYRKDPKKSANFVQCINTSKDKGTTIYNCHQNWRFVDFLCYLSLANSFDSQAWKLRPFTNWRGQPATRFARSLSHHLQWVIQTWFLCEKLESM